MKKWNISIIGAGFVGGACEIGFDKIANIKVYDKYKPSDSWKETISGSEIIFVCVPSPMNEDGSCNTSIVREVVGKISRTKQHKNIVIKSTVPPGTTAFLQKNFPHHTIMHNPEFLTEANYITDFLTQDRIIVGWDQKDNNKKHLLDVLEFYNDFIKTQENPAKMYTCHSDESEMCKYIGNCFLASKVIFFNEMWQICQASNIDYNKVIDLVKLDKRIGSSHMKVPGDKNLKGFGGSCFSKDCNSLISFAKMKNVDPLILESIWTKNLLVREEYDWEKLSQVTGKYKNKE